MTDAATLPQNSTTNSHATAQDPVFNTVLGKDWEMLGKIVRRHYFLRPFSNDYVCVKGTMQEVHHNSFAKLLIPLARIFGAMVPYRGKDVPIEVHYTARPDDGTIHWDRVFHFEGRPPFHFRSHMEHVGENRVIEFVRFGVGMRLKVTAENGALVFRDEGYIWRLFGVDVPLPMGLLMGRAYVEERPVDQQRFSMRMTLTHPLFGELFRYRGGFSLAGDEAVPSTVESVPR